MQQAPISDINENIMDEIRKVEKETLERSITRLVKNKVKIPDDQADIDLETRDYHLFVLKKRADDALACEHTKQNIYTK